ncbi:MAG: PspC domain-containing protein [Myxococcus sp.]|nr:PspC domain-containing protein [Myxococcus sp.]
MTDTPTRTCSACRSALDPDATRCPQCTQRQPDVVLTRDLPGRVAGGVCAALAHHFSWDVTLMRVLFVSSIAVTGGVAFWVYLAMWLMTPFRAHERAPLARFFDAAGNLFTSPNQQPLPTRE